MNKNYKYIGILLLSATITHSVERFNGRHFVKALWQQQSLEAIEAVFIQKTTQLMLHDPRNVTLSVCQTIAYQCKTVHAYVKRFFICLPDRTLLYSQQEQGSQLQSNEQCESLISYWKSRNFVALFSLYGWYFDCLSRLFIVSLEDVYCVCKETPQRSCEKQYVQAALYYQDMLELSLILQGTLHEERYIKYMNRYTHLLEYVHELCKLSAV